MKAYQLHQVDKMNDIHTLAWATNLAGATKKNGKPLFKRYDKFFDYEKAINQVLNGNQTSNIDKARQAIGKLRKGGD